MPPLPNIDFRWTHDDWGDSSVPAEPSPLPRLVERHAWLIRGAIILLALVLFKLTANAALATIAGCLEVARSDLRTAHWLWRVDPDRRRGRLLGACYVTRASSQVAGTAMIVLVAIVIVVIAAHEAGLGNPAPAPPGQVVGAFVTMALAFAWAAASSVGVCGVACWVRQKLWVGPEPDLARRQRIWPPSAVVAPGPSSNRATTIFLLAYGLVGIPGLIVTLFVCFAEQNGWKIWLFLPLVGTLAWAAGVVIKKLEARILARSPAECWPVDESVSTGGAASLDQGGSG